MAVLLLAAGCGPAAPAAPEHTVALYFRFLSRDPMRTLLLLTPAFHRAHGLHVVTSAEARASARPRGAAREPTPPSDYATDRYQLAWLVVQSREPFRSTFARVERGPLAVDVEGDRALVRVELRAPGVPPFTQRFALVRDPAGGAWRIDAVEQEGVVRANRGAAFVAYPHEAARLRLEQELRAAPRGSAP